MKESFVGTLTVISMLGSFPASAIFSLGNFQNAYHEGALARVEFSVSDEIGNPIPGAKVNVFFDMADRSKGEQIIVTTDANGVCMAEAKTKGVMEIEVSGDGYYRTKDRISLIAMGQEHEVVGGRWMPWGMRRDVVLRPISCPKAVRLVIHDWIDTKVINEWVGFDLQKYDYVAPVGKGEVGDMEIKFDWDGKENMAASTMGWLCHCVSLPSLQEGTMLTKSHGAILQESILHGQIWCMNKTFITNGVL